MQEIPITEAMFFRASKKANSLKILNNSITEGKGNIAGFLGEEIALSFLIHSLEKNTFDFDIILNDLKIDIKTKRTSVIPLPHFECSVSNYNTKQECDIYLFTRVLEIDGFISRGWLLGYIEKKRFYEKAIFHKQGEVDSDNNFTFKADCYNLSISELYPVNNLIPRKSSKVNIRDFFSSH
jgi:hypothetical protein